MKLNVESKKIELMALMYATVNDMREADWLSDPQYGSPTTLAEEGALYDKYQELLSELIKLNPDYINEDIHIVNQYGESLSFAQAQEVINIKINAFDSGNKKRRQIQAKMHEQQRLEQDAIKAKRLEEDEIKHQQQQLAELKQSLAPWRCVTPKSAVNESPSQKHQRLQSLAERYGFKSYLDSFREVYQALQLGTPLVELKRYTVIPEEDGELYSLLCIVEDFAIYQGTERNIAAGSKFTRLIALECEAAQVYERYSTLPRGFFSLQGKKRFAVKLATDLAFQLVEAEQEVLIYKHLGVAK
ncbi:MULTISPECIES: hypothetical protein [Pseudoalteromonas]|uniref:Uncharacterized protein n=1 Tax=Pseudoalteromonas luteoviolacea (strain 2ta16) TaxID=1353533 RepID=V4HJU9_PSEL2|nr:MULTISPECIES: hypothetical protein [Pseudoalteromonas]ESP91095.1 hypothetical protein PL2TA16_01102 [Pseudoalteromonas luteoviolacea 2ta16]KZN41372.1 hypothetical protein N483_15865 [Pseudoalteromonas luteoviolacea NCIMB 1944]MCG7550153.1 hypothetical protein [Pseudoalteromonas sp. Of7M-16]